MIVYIQHMASIIVMMLGLYVLIMDRLLGVKDNQYKSNKGFQRLKEKSLFCIIYGMLPCAAMAFVMKHMLCRMWGILPYTYMMQAVCIVGYVCLLDICIGFYYRSSDAPELQNIVFDVLVDIVPVGVVILMVYFFQPVISLLCIWNACAIMLVLQEVVHYLGRDDVDMKKVEAVHIINKLFYAPCVFLLAYVMQHNAVAVSVRLAALMCAKIWCMHHAHVVEPYVAPVAVFCKDTIQPLCAKALNMQNEMLGGLMSGMSSRRA